MSDILALLPKPLEYDKHIKGNVLKNVVRSLPFWSLWTTWHPVEPMEIFTLTSVRFRLVLSVSVVVLIYHYTNVNEINWTTPLESCKYRRYCFIHPFLTRWWRNVRRYHTISPQGKLNCSLYSLKILGALDGWVCIGSLIIPLKDKSMRRIRTVIMTEVDMHLLKFLSCQEHAYRLLNILVPLLKWKITNEYLEVSEVMTDDHYEFWKYPYFLTMLTHCYMKFWIIKKWKWVQIFGIFLEEMVFWQYWK